MKDALQALSLSGHRPYVKPSEQGWRYLGGGSHREAWLSPGRIVYKVSTGPWWANENEHDRVLDALLDTWDGEKSADIVPRFAHIHRADDGQPVLAMEHVPLPWGCKDCLALRGACPGCAAGGLKQIRLQVKQWGAWDVKPNNVRRRRDGTPVLIDWA